MKERESLLQSSNADFFPFGLKEYRLRRYIRRIARGSSWGKLCSLPLAVFQKVLFQFQGLALVAAVVFAATGSRAYLVILSPRAYAYAGGSLGLLLMLGVILLVAEAVCSYFELGSYGFSFHRLDLDRTSGMQAARHARRRKPRRSGAGSVIEMNALMGILITGYLVCSSLCYFLSLRIGGFGLLAGRNKGFFDGTRLFNAFYYTFTLVYGAGASPDTVLARLVSVSGMIVAIGSISVMLAIAIPKMGARDR